MRQWQWPEPVVTPDRRATQEFLLFLLDLASNVADVPVFIPGVPAAGDLVFAMTAVRSFSFPENMDGSAAGAEVAATGSVAFDLTRNGVSFGTVTFDTSAVGVFASTPVRFDVGDVLRVVAPSPADGTLADVRLTLRASR
jgi:hypothetical protein